jgi:acetyl-CoA carboxylase biotin carboxyl carrier protein
MTNETAMTITYEDVQNILKIIDSSALEEVHLELGDFKLVVRRHGAAASPAIGQASPTSGLAPTPARATSGGTGSAAATPTRETARPVSPRSSTPRTHGVEIKAPMVGTFYRAPAPGAPPFVEVGSIVDEDDTVCILEVMKLMNSIKAGCRGRVAEICVENATLVEFGSTLLVIEPVP